MQLQSIVQCLTHRPDILGHLTHSSNAICLEKVVVPSVGWNHIVLKIWVGGDRRRRDSICSSSVFVKRDASAERADSREAGCNKASAKIAGAIAHLIVRLLALGVEVEKGWWFDLDEENGVLVELHGEHPNNIDYATGSLGGIIMREDFERPFDAKKVVQEPLVRSVVGALIIGELRLVGGQE